MPIRVVKEGVVVMRDGKSVRPKVGTEFNFTDAEIAELVGTADAPGTRPECIGMRTAEVADGPVAKPVAKAAVVAAKGSQADTGSDDGDSL